MKSFLHVIFSFLIIIVYATPSIAVTTGDVNQIGSKEALGNHLKMMELSSNEIKLIKEKYTTFSNELNTYDMSEIDKMFFLSYYPPVDKYYFKNSYQEYINLLIEVCGKCRKYEQQLWFMFNTSADCFKDIRLQCKSPDKLNTVLYKKLEEFAVLSRPSGLYSCIVLDDNSIQMVTNIFTSYFVDHPITEHQFTAEQYLALLQESEGSPISDKSADNIWGDSSSSHSDSYEIVPTPFQIAENFLSHTQKKLHASITKTLVNTAKHLDLDSDDTRAIDIWEPIRDLFPKQLRVAARKIKVFFRRQDTVAWIVLILEENTNGIKILDPQRYDPHISLLKLVTSNNSFFNPFDKAMIEDYVQTANQNLSVSFPVNLIFHELLLGGSGGVWGHSE